MEKFKIKIVKTTSKNITVKGTFIKDGKTGYQIEYKNGESDDNGVYWAYLAGDYYKLVKKIDMNRKCKCCGSDISNRPLHYYLCYNCWNAYSANLKK